MGNSTLAETYRERTLQDLLDAERAMRAHLSGERKRLAALLLRLARQYHGTRLEAFRREDPRSIEDWTAADWERFFASSAASAAPPAHPSSQGWRQTSGNGNGNGGGAAKSESAPDIAALKAALKAEVLRELRQQLPQPAPSTPAPRTPTSAPQTKRLKPRPEARSNALAVPPRIALDDFKLPLIPLKYSHLEEEFSGLRWRRAVMILHIISAAGINVLIEIGRHIGAAEGFAPHSNSVKAPFKQLGEAGMLHIETLKIDHPQRGFALVLGRLTDAGRDFCQAVGWKPVESEWERLIRLHEGERQREHALAVLYFAVMARARGYTATVMPQVKAGNTPLDVLLEKDGERILAEVELGRHDRTAKWRNLRQAQGFAALCTLYPEDRERLANDCKLAHIPGRATDLETLRSTKLRYDLSGEPLWLETWE